MMDKARTVGQNSWQSCLRRGCYETRLPRKTRRQHGVFAWEEWHRAEL